MLPYFLCFILSIFFTYLAGNKKVMLGKIEISSKFFSAIAIFFPCFLAAIRDSSIGTDVLVYGDKLFELAKKYDSIVVYLSHTDVEKLFGIIVFILAHISNRYIYYFVLQFLVIFPIYSTLFRNISKEYAWFGIMIYLLWMYPFSLNVMRQSIAIAILIWNSKNIKEKKLIKYLFWCIIASGFHITGIIGILLYLIDFLTTYEYNRTKTNNDLKIFKKFNKVIIIICVLIVVLIGIKLVEYLCSVTGLYLDQLSFRAEGNIDIVNIFLMIILIGLIYDYRNEESNISYYFFLIIIGSILYQIKSSLSQMYRISVYFTGYIILIFPAILNKIKSVKKKEIVLLIMLLISCVNFWYYIVISGWHSVYPFITTFHGI